MTPEQQVILRRDRQGVAHERAGIQRQRGCHLAGDTVAPKTLWLVRCVERYQRREKRRDGERRTCPGPSAYP